MSELDRFLGENGGVSSFKALEDRLTKIWGIAHEFGLDPFPTHFEMIPPTQMHEIASYGLPHRFSHWTHGRDYRHQKTMHDYGLSRLYEVVINANPSQAYLLENNSDIENTVVMAHVLGHTDFFKNNRLFQATRRDMPHASSTYAGRIKQFEFEHGKLVVESFLDSALSIAEHVDAHNVVRPSKDEQVAKWREEFEEEQRPRKAANEFADLFPEDRAAEKKRRDDAIKQRMAIPLHPDKDLLGFIADYGAYLKDWQREALQIVRAESLYFHPQRRTKIMNEGYASYWHKRIMQEMSNRGYLNQEEEFRWVAMHSGVVSPNPKSLNPYYFGMMMFEFIEDYNNGNLTDLERRQLERADMVVFPPFKGDYIGSPGHSKVREAMMFDDDQSFVRNHFCQVPAERMNMYVYKEQEDYEVVNSVVAEKSWEKIRDALVRSMDNSGDPYLAVTDADYSRNGELYIKHSFEGQELDIAYLERTLPHVYNLWGRSTHLETVVKGEATRFSFDGEKVSRQAIKTS